MDGITPRISRGEVFGILGPDGAGKITTVECAAGLRRPDGDTVRHRVGVQLQQAVLPDRDEPTLTRMANEYGTGIMTGLAGSATEKRSRVRSRVRS